MLRRSRTPPHRTRRRTSTRSSRCWSPTTSRSAARRASFSRSIWTRCGPPQQRDEIGKLCARLWPADYRQQLGLAVALSQLKTPWETNQQDEDISKLYALMQRTKDETLNRYLDDALANAKGLYFDAINDYNTINDAIRMARSAASAR